MPNRTFTSFAKPRSLALLSAWPLAALLASGLAFASQDMQEGSEPGMEPGMQQSMEEMDGAMEGGMGAEIAAPAPLSADDVKFFESEIRPLLIANCYGCHSTAARLARGGLKLDTREATLKGGKSGPAVVPGDVDSSLLVRAVRYHDEDYEMPPAGKLPDAAIAVLEKWVEMGAPDPRSESAAATSAGASPGTSHRWTADDIANARSTHWAYQPVASPEAPVTRNSAWPRVAIDSFVLSELEERGLTPAPDADRRTLLRRASLDLVGLAPSAEELERFAKDASPDAFAKAVDRLLASPQFGERWGRHWLDVARYAESSGKESNLFYPHAWRYRDYVIEAFNEDKPYDRFLAEQLAGDLLPSSNPTDRAEKLIATGYLAIGTKSHNARGKQQFQMDLADEQLDATTQGMLGLTVACARCHDHKFDPIPQRDYYALAGVFLSTETRYGTFDAQQNNHPAPLVALPKDADVPMGPTMPATQRSLIARAAERVAAEAERSEQLLEEARAIRRAGNEPSAQLQQQIVRARVTNGAKKNLDSIVARFDEDGAPTEANLVAMGAQDRARALNARLLDRGELDKPGAAVPRGFVALVSDGDEARITKGSGRLELAEWITDRDNPLTARVWANRVWQHLFGAPIVPTPDNFGMSGQRPTHPELLDHLATRLVANGWSTKALIREIMLSRAYAMSSAFDADDASIDPENTYLWRMNKKRLEAEAIRDSMLATAGILDRTAPVGSPVAMAEGGLRGQQQQQLLANFLSGDGSNHRSVYLPIVRDKVPESLEVFDFAEPAFVTGRRDTTNVPTQALYLMNSAEVARVADAFSRRVLAEATDDDERLLAAFELAFGRKPTASELSACRGFLRDFRSTFSRAADTSQGGVVRAGSLRERARQRIQQRMAGAPAEPTPFTSPEQAAYSSLCQALLLSAEFRTVD